MKFDEYSELFSAKQMFAQLRTGLTLGVAGATADSEKCGAGIARWLQRRTRDRKVAGSSPGRNGRSSFFSRVNFLRGLLFRYPFHPCVTAVVIIINNSYKALFFNQS